MMPSDRVSARRAIEALRAGVPTSDAIRRLGCPDEGLEIRFEAALDSVADATTPGFAVAGGFGTGKSHLLGYLREAALHRDCVVSTVTVSKETPLSIPGVTYATAMRNATVRGANDDAITLALTRIERTEGAVESLELWASTPEAGIAPVFQAILYLLTRSTDPELRHAIEAFLADAKPPLPPLRRALKEKRVRTLFDLAPVAAADLLRQRMRFMPQLFCAAGFAGWVVLLDEVELIGRYGPLQRALAYAEIAQWLGLHESARIPCLFAACAARRSWRTTPCWRCARSRPRRICGRPTTPTCAAMRLRSATATAPPMAGPHRRPRSATARRTAPCVTTFAAGSPSGTCCALPASERR